MFRFYRITTFVNGRTYIDYNGLADYQDVKDELEKNGLLDGTVVPDPYGFVPFRYQDFLIYEG